MRKSQAKKEEVVDSEESKVEETPEVKATESTEENTEEPSQSEAQEEITEPTPSIHLDKANQIVKEHTLYSMGSGILPIPVVGLVGVLGIQIKMINELCKEYEVEFKESRAKNILLSIAGAIAPVAIAMPVASLVKFIPVIGQSAGSIALSSMSSASTYTVGHYLINHFENDGTLEDVEPSKTKEQINKIYEKSKDAIKNLKKSVTKSEEPTVAAAE